MAIKDPHDNDYYLRNNPNPRIREAYRNGERVGMVTTVPKSMDPKKKVYFKRPQPCVTILVHGVNDVGEAYATQAAGICEGLNHRLGRADLTPGNWDVPRACPNTRVASYERRYQEQGYNAILPFYWGYRPVDQATYAADQARYREELRRRGPAGAEAPYDAYYLDGRSDPKRGFQNVDCFNNRLDEQFAKNGGVFANATSNLIDMWGPGGKLFGVVRFLSTRFTDDLSHPIYDNPHRIYLVNAAQRLANLILMIRGNPTTKDDSINIVAHSQGTLVAMLANFLVAHQEEERPADCLILNHSPYSLETPALESGQSLGPQQSARARADTLVNFCKLMDQHKLAGPTAEVFRRMGIAHSQAIADAHCMRDNHGKVFNYFCPHDQVVSLLNVQGMGWQGVAPSVSDRAGPAFVQRMFLHGRALSVAPGKVALPALDMPIANRDLPEGAIRDLNGPRLPDLGFVFELPGGCPTLGASDWGVNSAAAAVKGTNLVVEPGFLADPRPGAPLPPPGSVRDLPAGEVQAVQSAFRGQGKPWTLVRVVQSAGGLRVTRLMTAEELEAQAQKTPTSTSHHSAIVLNQQASRCVTAFDLAIGRCRSYDETKIDGGKFWQKLLQVADWRDSELPDDRLYYQKGILPPDTKAQMNKPPSIPGIVNETTDMQVYGDELRRIDAEIAQLNRDQTRWPPLEWNEKMRSLERQREIILTGQRTASQKSQLYPVAHQP